MSPKTLAVLGTAMILVALLVFWMAAHWEETRSFEPVNMPVLLEAGKIQSTDFEINLRDEYGIQLSADYSIDDWTEGKCNSGALREIDWKVYRLGKIRTHKELWASSEEMKQQSEWPYGFHGLPGKYELEWRVPAAATCLNARHPRLRVWTTAEGYETVVILILLACMVVVFAGAAAILRAMVIWLVGILRRKDSLRIFPEMALRNVIPARPRRPMPLIIDLQNFVLVYVWILWILWMIFMVLQPRIPIGLFVNFNGERTVGVEKSPWTETMAVYVDAKQGFFVNGKHVAREELRSKLQEELLRRGIWVVYFEADGDCLYMDAVYAIDTIQGLGAKLIWITPKTREEWKNRGVS
ncbi:MAG TPA: hypothetical protein VH114_11075 [Candidatus Acidoferrum sp.]|jgi:biopolymer transport protein ExbD|nr:hypothetical protein [Candidatus Acidoferrum sp.]